MKTLILVIGCHRSGTSAVIGSLFNMGVAIHERILIAKDNPKGFFESREVVDLHERLLAENGGSWESPPTITRGRVRACDEIAAVIRGLPGPICAVKDPRASLFVDLWRQACKDEGVRLCVLEVCRDRDAIAASLMRREGWDRTRARRLVSEYTEAIGRARARHCGPWETIRFPSELRSEVAWRRIFTSFGLNIVPNMDILRAFVDDRLIHYGDGGKDAGSPPLWSVIIPSRSDAKVIGCVASLIDTHPEIRSDQIVIVDDGLSLRTRWRLRGVTWVRGVRPFIFARAVNMGTAAASSVSDLVVLGDDVRFATPSALDRLAASLQGAAAIAPEVVGVCGQSAQRAGAAATEADWLAFICAYIPRLVWDQVGPLDERFVGYGYDDVDWCKRAQGYGSLKIAHDVKVLHLQDSSYRGREDWKLRYEENRSIFEDKWRPREVA
jgi:hypothetical protein